MNKFAIKKIVVSIVILATVAMITPSVARGITAAELQAQIDALLASLATLQAQLATLTGTSGAPAACAGITSFATNLSQGSTGADVKCLQALLNASADTQVAASGVGSAGNETMTFGSLTKAAVMKYQTKNSIVPVAGYVGPITRAKLNTALGGGTPGVDVCPNIDGVQTTVPTGKVKDTSGNCVDTVTGGAEGSLAASLNSVPADSKEVYTKTTGNGVLGVELQANGSDIVVKRFDATFNRRPWLYIKNLTITDGTTSKTVAVTEAGTNEITVGSSYTIIMSNLSFLIPKGTKKVLTVNVDGVDELPSGVTSQAVTIQAGANAFRGLDGAGIDQYAPSAALTARTFTSKSGDTANLEISAHVDNPKARNEQVQSTAETTGVVLAKFNLKATNRDAILRTLTLTDANASGTGGTISVLSLYDGETVLSSTSSVASTASSTQLTNINLTIPKDTTKVLTLKATIPKATGNYMTGNAESGGSGSSSITVEAQNVAIDAEDASTFAAATISGSTVSPGAAYFFTKMPTLTLATTPTIASVAIGSASITKNTEAVAKIRINVTAVGGDIYVATATGNDVTATTSVVASSAIAESITSDADSTTHLGAWLVPSGKTHWFEISGRLTLPEQGTAGGIPLWTNMSLTNLKWATTGADAAAAGTNNNQTWGLDNFKTGDAYLELW